jgi:hypothetical protein
MGILETPDKSRPRKRSKLPACRFRTINGTNRKLATYATTFVGRVIFARLKRNEARRPAVNLIWNQPSLPLDLVRTSTTTLVAHGTCRIARRRTLQRLARLTKASRRLLHFGHVLNFLHRTRRLEILNRVRLNQLVDSQLNRRQLPALLTRDERKCGARR